MKKIILSTLMFFCLAMTGCSDNNEPSVEEDFKPSFLVKYSTRVMDDGWVYHMVINYPDKDSKEINTAYLGGVNIKYKKMAADGGIPILDEEGNVIASASGIMPDLTRINKYAGELEAIHNFLTKHQFNEPIDVNSLNGLETIHFSKELLVEMYNEALASNPTFGKYGYLSSDCKQKNDSEGNIIQISLLNQFGNIEHINIEYIYKDGTYLSDKVKLKEDTKLSELQKKIDAFEQQLVETQDYKIEHSFTEISGLDVEVDTLIKTIFEPKDEE